MSPVYIVLALTLVLRLAGWTDMVAIHSWIEATRWATGFTFILMGSAHFTPIRHDVARLVPPWIPRPLLVVTLLGAWQIAGGIGLITPALRRAAATALVVLLLLKLPANLRIARESLSLRGKYATPPTWRVPAQILWITLVAWSGS